MYNHSILLLCCCITILISSALAFVPSTFSSPSSYTKTTTTQLAFGIPSFLTPKNDDDEEKTKTMKKVGSSKDTKDEKKDEKKISIGGVLQLIAAGAGAPFLGNYEGVDKETGKFMFTLEANNLVDDKGQSKQTQMPYFENGWVDENDNGGFQWPWEKKEKTSTKQ